MKRWTLTLMLITLAARVGAYTVPYETWMGAYLGDAKIGYLTMKVDKAEFEGVQGYRIASVIDDHLTVLGADLTQHVTSVVFTDTSYNPLQEEFAIASGGKTMTVSARFTKTSIDCIVSAGSGASKKSIPVPKGVSLVGDSMFANLDPAPEVGREYKLNYFNPLTLAIDDLTVKVDRREKIEVGGKECDTLVLRNITPMGEMTIWQEPGGDVVKVNAIMGISMIRQSKQEATSGIKGTVDDFAVVNRVRTDKPIPKPREAKILDLIVNGLDDPRMAITDSRQKAIRVKSRPGSVHLRITAKDVRDDDAAAMPFADEKLKEYLAATPYVDSDVQSVKDQVAQIAPDEKNAGSLCKAIRAWLNSNLQVKADIGITRSASDVLKSKVGVCRDYAILFAALARSRGIPAKVVSGLLYLQDGFYYHAWVECYVGQWVPFDATLTTDFVDATHIKLAEGDATSMFSLAKVIGSLKAEIKGSK